MKKWFVLMILICLCGCSEQFSLEDIKNNEVTSLTVNVTYTLKGDNKNDTGTIQIKENENEMYLMHDTISYGEEISYEEWKKDGISVISLYGEAYEIESDPFKINGCINNDYVDEITSSSSDYVVTIKEENVNDFLRESGIINLIGEMDNGPSISTISINVENNRIIKEQLTIYYVVQGEALTVDYTLIFSDFDETVLPDIPEVMDEDYAYEGTSIEHDITLNDKDKLLSLGYKETEITGQFIKDDIIVDVVYKWIIMTDGNDRYYYDWEYDTESDNNGIYDETLYLKGKEIYESVYNSLYN